MRDFVMVPTEEGGLNNVNFDGGCVSRAGWSVAMQQPAC